MKIAVLIVFLFISISFSGPVDLTGISVNLYPHLNETKPDLPSPFTVPDGNEYVIAVTRENKYALMPVTLSNERSICKQLVMDSTDFPVLVKTGLHSDSHLAQLTHITGRSLEKITQLARPGGLSFDGFLAQDEDILSVLRTDNRIVKKLGFTHPQLAVPLFHVLNMMDEDLALNRWNMARHEWEHIRYFFYNGRKVNVIAYDTKGGQQSIFDDGLQGAFHIKLWTDFTDAELQLLTEKYGHLSEAAFDSLKSALSFINMGELEPQYIMRYGFYEGHTFWRTDPVAIAFIFGMKSLHELEAIFKSDLYEVMIEHHTQ